MIERKVAIVAKAATSAFAPWQDRSWEIWGLPWIIYPRVDRLFELHERGRKPGNPDSAYHTTMKEWVARTNATNIPVFCDPSWMMVFRNAVKYPLDDIFETLPFAYLENSIAYQLALAIHENVDEIGLWGVHMMGKNEYAWERPSVTYLIGLAQGRGIKVHVAEGSPLFMSRWESGRYGRTDSRI